jgi:hypothetical protein
VIVGLVRKNYDFHFLFLSELERRLPHGGFKGWSGQDQGWEQRSTPIPEQRTAVIVTRQGEKGSSCEGLLDPHSPVSSVIPRRSDDEPFCGQVRDCHYFFAYFFSFPRFSLLVTTEPCD